MEPVSLRAGPDGALDVIMRGEIDFTISAELVAAICAAVQRDRPTLVQVHLGEVTFLDSSGIGVLVRAMRAADEVGSAFRVLDPAPKVLDQLQISGLLEVFGMTGPRPEE